MIPTGWTTENGGLEATYTNYTTFASNNTNEPEKVPLVDSQDLISQVCDEIKEMLLEKNRKYGDSALHPTRIFAKSDSIEQIKVRIDDKLNRLKNAQGDEDEDVVMDLMGYLVLLRVAYRIHNNEPVETVIAIDWVKKFGYPPVIPYQPYDIGTPYIQPWNPPYDGTPYVTWNTYDDGHTQCSSSTPT